MCYKCDNTTLPIFNIVPPEVDTAEPWEPKGVAVKHRKKSDEKLMVPKPRLIMQNIRYVSSCVHRNTAIDCGNNLWEWGAISKARLEDGSYSDDIPQNIKFTPQKIMEQVLSVGCGAWHMLCITNDKKLWSLGKNEFGQLGIGSLQKQVSPTFVMDGVQYVCANEYQSFAIREDHTLWGWGDNEFGTLLGSEEYYCQPKLLMDSVTYVSCGNQITAAIKRDGTLWAWGNNMRGTIFTQPQYRYCPPTPLMDEIASVSLPASENCDYGLAITKSGDLYLFGGTKYGSLMNKQFRKQTERAPIKLASNISEAYAGNDFILMKDYWGRLFSLGRNDLGQCGNGKSSSFLKKTELIMGHTLQAAVGHHHGIGLQENGNLWIWGGDYGVLVEF